MFESCKRWIPHFYRSVEPAPKRENLFTFVKRPRRSLTEKTMGGFGGVVWVFFYPILDLRKSFSHTTLKVSLNLLIRLLLPFPSFLQLHSMCRRHLPGYENLIPRSMLAFCFPEDYVIRFLKLHCALWSIYTSTVIEKSWASN